jgi:hypothetical protein
MDRHLPRSPDMTNIKYKSKIVDGQEVCFASDWIYDLETEVHFNWYYHQADMVYRNLNRNHKILEIGIGTGLLSELLKRRKWDIKTLDIDEEKHPDFCESAIDFDYREHGIEAVLAFEIFEHIPFSTFKKVVGKLCRSEINTVCFSLPWCERELVSFSLKLPKLSKMQWSLRVPIKKIYTKAHCWELSTVDMPVGKKQLIGLHTLLNLFADHEYSVALDKKVGCIQYFCATR